MTSRRAFSTPLTLTILFLAFVGVGYNSSAQDLDSEFVEDANKAYAEFMETDASLVEFAGTAYGYAVFPNIGKAAIGIGGAHGNGVVYEQGNLIGSSDMKQVTIGFQFGGQAYSQLIFFENKEALDGFTSGSFELAAQASAVAAAAGASANAPYERGVAIFTMASGGLMYEASVGGQKFSFEGNSN